MSKKINWKIKTSVLVIILCLLSSFVMSTTIKTNDFKIKETFLEEIGYYLSPLGDNFIPPWEETYLLEYDAAKFYSVSATSDDAYIISGEAREGSDYNFLLVKTDALGNVLFYNDYGGSEWDRARHAEQTSDGGYIITGYTYSYGLGGSDVYLVKTDSEGTMLWSKNFGGYDDDAGVCVRQTSDGGYIIIGSIHTPGYDLSDCWLIKTDSQGNLIWDQIFYLPEPEIPDHIFYGVSVQQTADDFYLPDLPDLLNHTGYYNGADFTDYGVSVQQTADGGYVFPLFTVTLFIWGPVHLIKTDSAGNIEWMTEPLGEYGVSSGSESIQITSDNSYIVCWGELSILGEPDYENPSNNGFITKVNSDGTLAWDTHLVSVGMIGYFNSVKQTPDGGYIAVGQQHKRTNIWDLWLVKFDSEGNYKWGKFWDDSDRHEFGGCVEVDSNGDYLIAGHKMVFENGWRNCGWLIHELKISESAPNKPDPPEGPNRIRRDTTYSYIVSTTDPEGDDIRYCIYWGIQGLATPDSYTWTDLVASGEEVTVTHSWEEDGEYVIQVLAVDDSNLESEWSDPEPISVSHNTPQTWVLSDTQITMSDGSYKNIEDIVVGDYVQSYDTVNETFIEARVESRVTGVYEEENPYGYLILINDNLHLTPDSLLYGDNEWISADEVQIDDHLMGSDGEILITSVGEDYESQDYVFGLELEIYHTYFANGYLVHA